ncbi:MAG: hypothetical protein ICV63_14345 [Coleofasciculus sp. Co-bin14]|nr:hypothetical protein [Coleofasciculus sp. Co-bin14]
MAALKNLRDFSATEKAKAKKELVDWMSEKFDLPEGESYEQIADDAIGEVKNKAIDLFNEKAMVESLVFKAQRVISEWVDAS